MTLLFYTTADGEYEKFVPLYIYTALSSTPESYVEVGLEDSDQFVRNNAELVRYLRELFGSRFKITTVEFNNRLPGVVRFVTEPELADKCDYVYIGDIDMLIFDKNLKSKHLENMSENDAPFSNIIRGPAHTEGDNYRLSGLHFAPTDVQYPIPDLTDIDYSQENDVRGADENVLYKIMKRKGYMISEDMDFRPVHGIHMRTNSHPFGSRKRVRPNNSFEEISSGDVRVPWSGLEVEDYRNSFTQMLNEPQFQSMYFQLDIEIKNLLMILENVAEGRFDSFEEEAFTYIITEAYYETLIRKVTRIAYDDGIGSAFKSVVEHIYQKIKQQ